MGDNDDMTTESFWHPPDFSKPDSGRLGRIKAMASEVYPANEYGDLAAKISQYLISKLQEVWAAKSKDIKAKDLKYNPEDPLSRIEQKTVLISYADSVWENGETALSTLEKFLVPLIILQFFYTTNLDLHTHLRVLICHLAL